MRKMETNVKELLRKEFLARHEFREAHREAEEAVDSEKKNLWSMVTTAYLTYRRALDAIPESAIPRRYPIDDWYGIARTPIKTLPYEG